MIFQVREKLIELTKKRAGMNDQWETRWEYLKLSKSASVFDFNYCKTHKSLTDWPDQTVCIQIRLLSDKQCDRSRLNRGFTFCNFDILRYV